MAAMQETVSVSAAEIREGTRRFGLATLEGYLEDPDDTGARRGRGTVHLLREDRARNPRGLFLELTLADGRSVLVIFLTWHESTSTGEVELISAPEPDSDPEG